MIFDIYDREDSSGGMKRLGIIVIYDKFGKIDRYIDRMISATYQALHKLIIIINGSVQRESYFGLQKYSSSIFIRANQGFDAGAYRDIFLKYIPQQEWSAYDEVILMNDTFYGPIYPLENIWGIFEQIEADFWGITKHPNGLYPNGQEMPSHIQGYFFVIRKRMLCSKEFYKFWEEMPDLHDIYDVIKEFEVRFTTYFEECGFKGKALMDLGSPPLEIEYNKNPYFTYNLRLIRDKGIPFLKKKSLLFQTKGYEETIDAIEYMEKEKLYDTSLIWENIFRLCREKQFKSVFNYFELEKFYGSHERIFIYGAGKYGQRIKRYFEYRKWKYECFLVSRQEDVREGCVRYEDITFALTDGIIMALNQKNLEEVLDMVNDIFSAEQMFLPEWQS